MSKKSNKIKIFSAFLAVCVLTSLSFSFYAQGLVRYPSVASLGVGDIKSSHIRDATIVDADVNASAAILSDKITYSGDTATSTQNWGHILDYFASITTTTDNLIVSDGSGWIALTTSTLWAMMELGSMSYQNTTSTSITGGSISGITDLSLADGGTGQSLDSVAQGSVPYFNATGTLTTLAAGASGQVLKSGGAFANLSWGGAATGDGHITLLPWNASSSIQGNWVFSANAGQLFDFTYVVSGGSDGDSFAMQLTLSQGTYTLKTLNLTTSNAGIMDIDIEGTEVASFDLYSSGSVFNILNTQQQISIATSGLKTLVVRIDGKNGSSSGYAGHITYITLFRTE